MDNSEFSKIYWNKLKVMVGVMISEAPLYNDKNKYVIDCWEKIKNEIEKIDISNADRRATFAKLRKQIEDAVLKK